MKEKTRLSISFTFSQLFLLIYYISFFCYVSCFMGSRSYGEFSCCHERLIQGWGFESF